MSRASERHHGYTSDDAAAAAEAAGREGESPDAEGPEAGPPEPPFAERVRTLLARAEQGTLATRSRRRPSYPFASLMPYAVDSLGRPVVLVSDLAVHTRNLKADARASLLVAEPEDGERDPLGLPRATLLGRCFSVDGVPAEEVEEVRRLYLERHPGANYWVDYSDFHFRRMEVEEAYFVGGFGVMGWVSGAELREAEPDPLRAVARSILRHMNRDHSDALLLLARDAGIDEAEEARMTAVDRLGCHLRVRVGDRVRGLRLGFPFEARSPERVREALVEQVREARERL